MGILLTLCTYLALLIFFGVALSKFLTLWNASRAVRAVYSERPRNPLLVMKMAGDIIFLARLLKTNDLLWIGEWIFHSSFVLVVLRHLRFILDPVPAWVLCLQTPGLIAAYILPVSLMYILAMKLGKEKGYLPSYNFFLLVLLLVMGVTGLFVKTVFLTDISTVKTFMLGVLTFSPADPPSSFLFSVHYILSLILLVCLPSHIFTAPFVIIEARMRDEELGTVMHEK
ncbi:MAG TPA: hypothetical protein VN328_04965 [Thermodesulfovibrionales bacterium]|nr:hypothetical protein [Thermodesulfovibrionales bacterium]